MKKHKRPSLTTVHPTVAREMVLENGGESIATDHTDKKLSPHAGSAVFWKFLHPSGFIGKLKELLPHRLPASYNAIQPIDNEVAFVQGLLGGRRNSPM